MTRPVSPDFESVVHVTNWPANPPLGRSSSKATDSIRVSGCLILYFAASMLARGDVELVSDQPPQAVFAGRVLSVPVAFRNSSGINSEANLRFRLYQASAATLLPLAEARSWKTLLLPPGQTALNNVEVDLPTVRAETLFHLVWFEGQKKVGTTLVRAFPDKLLQPLAVLAGDTPPGLPRRQIKAGIPRTPVQRTQGTR